MTVAAEMLVLGASNEIMMDGWTKHVRDLGVDVARWCVGGCGSSAGVYSLLKNGAIEASVAIMSYEINEFLAMENGLCSNEDVRQNWSWMVNRLRKMDILPVLMILPRTRNDRFFSSEAHKLQVQIAKDLCVHYIDFMPLFTELESEGLQASTFMSDNAHATIPTQAVIGYITSQITKALVEAPRTKRKFKFSHSEMRLVTPTPLDGCKEPVERGDSMMQGSFVPTEGDFFFRLSDEYITSLGLNRGAPGAIIEIDTGSEKYAKQFAYGADADSSFMFVVSDLGCKPGRLPLFSIVSDDTPVTEKTVHGQPLKPGLPRSVEVEAAIAATNKKVSRVATQAVPDVPLDLLTGKIRGLAKKALISLVQTGAKS